MNRRLQARAVRVPHRFSALLVALLWCAAPVLAALHADAEVHRYCAEHGALEEAGAPPSAEPAADAAAAGAPLASVEGSEQPSAHDGCAFGEYCRFGQLLRTIILDFAGEVGFAPAPPPATAPPAVRVAIVRVAPKTSPPRA